MNIAASQIGQLGPGIDLSNQEEGLTIQTSDPVHNMAYARNAVTLTCEVVEL